MDSFGFALPRSVIDVENLHHSLNQSDANQTKTNYDLAAIIFPHFRHFSWFYIDFSLAVKVLPFL